MMGLPMLADHDPFLATRAEAPHRLPPELSHTVPLDIPSYEQAMLSIGQLLIRHPLARELQERGMSISLSASAAMLCVLAERSDGPGTPVFKARRVGAQWWDSADDAHCQRIATQLATELRTKWDCWKAGTVH